jgi:hypothetical protein
VSYKNVEGLLNVNNLEKVNIIIAHLIKLWKE